VLVSGLAWGRDCFLMRATADGGYSNVVDLYDSGTRLWSTAQLSQARRSLAATSVRTVAIFAGGFSITAVDLYDRGTGGWSTAQLSVARDALAATSVGTVAIFAGGELLMTLFV
jgi:hypothetical protein